MRRATARRSRVTHQRPPRQQPCEGCSDGGVETTSTVPEQDPPPYEESAAATGQMSELFDDSPPSTSIAPPAIDDDASPPSYTEVMYGPDTANSRSMTVMAEFFSRHLPIHVGDDDSQVPNDTNEVDPEGNPIRTITFGNNNGGIQVVGGLRGGVVFSAGGVSIQPAQIGTSQGFGITVGGVSIGGVQTASIGGTVEVTSTRNGHNITFSSRGDSAFGAASSAQEAALELHSQARQARDHALEARQQANAERREALARAREMRAEARRRASSWVDRTSFEDTDGVESGSDLSGEDDE